VLESISMLSALRAYRAGDTTYTTKNAPQTHKGKRESKNWEHTIYEQFKNVKT